MRSNRILAAVALALACAVVPAAPASAAATPPVPAFSAVPDDYAHQDSVDRCDAGTKPGVSDFYQLLRSTYPGLGERNWGTYVCDPSTWGGHDQGRALDWGLNSGNAGERDIASTVLGWLLATRDGEPHAIARRLGINFIIWNRQIIYLMTEYSDHNWHPYGGASPHTDHIHFEFGWAGAQRQTTWWTARDTGRVQLIGPGRDSCPSGYLCAWEHADFTGRGVAMFNNEDRWWELPGGLSLINDTGSSFLNADASWTAVVCEHYTDNPDGLGGCVTFPPGTEISNAGGTWMNDTMSHLHWTSGSGLAPGTKPQRRA
ncbi:peptidase inhibitor family I36 protein [Longispora albida]|uniref:peptidase inhibitor family I36 protein n=1 Tax=Longispora albida TaxID=203523 RepID=UPI00036A9494|nr:peptidase inhibitor family I36 protein [Longispora albida]